MTAARRGAVAIAVAAAVATFSGAGAAAPPEEARRGEGEAGACRRFVEAFTAQDDAAMREIAGDPALDAHQVADVFLARHAHAVTRKPVDADLMAAALAYADRVAESRPEARGLPEVVAAWKALPRDALERDLRLRAAFRRAKDAERREASREMLEVLEAARDDLAAAAPSPSVLAVRSCEVRAYTAAGRAGDAEAACHAAIATADALRWPRGKALYLRHLGLARSAADPEGSLAAYEDSLALYETFGPTTEATVGRIRVCQQLRRLGRLAEALEAGERALEQHARSDGSPERLARILLELALTRADLVDVPRAIELNERARLAWEAAGDEVQATEALLRAALLRLALGDTKSAEEGFRRVLVASEARGDRPRLAKAWHGLGRAATQRGDPGAAVSMHERAAALASDAGDRMTQTQAWTGLGNARWALGEVDAAISAFERAIALGTEHGVRPPDLALPWRMLSQAYARAGRPGDAVRAARAGVRIRRENASDLGEGFGALDQKAARSTADGGVLAALRWAAASPGERDEAVAAAFALVESTRAAFLVEALEAGAGAGTDARGEAPPDAEARRAFEEARRRLLLLSFGGPADAEALRAAREEYEAASARRAERLAHAALRREDDRAPPEPVSLGEARSALPEGAALVLFHQTNERMLALAADRDGADLVDLGPTDDVLTRIRSWLAAVSTPNGSEGDLPSALYDLLLRPLEPRLGRARTLLVGRDRGLSFVPFEALVEVRDGVRRRVVEARAVAYVPSATAYATLVRRERPAAGRDRLVALGDPVYPGEAGRRPAEAARASDRGLSSLARLPASAEEVRDVAARFPEDRRVVLLREDATRERLTSAIAGAGSRLRLLHVACHGFADERQADRSGLVLSSADVLTVDDVRRLRVPADLVVVSACESGLGVARYGEGVLALPRAFLAAGAGRVLAVDRPVADEDARALLRPFYAALLDEGLDPASALRAAKLTRLRAGGAAAHPYAWAGFVLWD